MNVGLLLFLLTAEPQVFITFCYCDSSELGKRPEQFLQEYIFLKQV